MQKLIYFKWLAFCQNKMKGKEEEPKAEMTFKKKTLTTVTGLVSLHIILIMCTNPMRLHPH